MSVFRRFLAKRIVVELRRCDEFVVVEVVEDEAASVFIAVMLLFDVSPDVMLNGFILPFRLEPFLFKKQIREFFNKEIFGYFI